jgi:hypothetical protein
VLSEITPEVKLCPQAVAEQRFQMLLLTLFAGVAAALISARRGARVGPIVALLYEW